MMLQPLVRPAQRLEFPQHLGIAVVQFRPWLGGLDLEGKRTSPNQVDGQAYATVRCCAMMHRVWISWCSVSKPNHDEMVKFSRGVRVHVDASYIRLTEEEKLGSYDQGMAPLGTRTGQVSCGWLLRDDKSKRPM